jgi:REP element-mobilizing transposase RayT
MATTPQNHRRPLRLQDFDYSQNGAYFVTIVTQGRSPLFGEGVNGEMVLNEVGKVVEQVWLEIPGHFHGVNVHTYVIMPNHIHGIIEIERDDRSIIVGARHASPLHPNEINTKDTRSFSLGTIIGSFKSAVTKRYHIMTNTQNIPLWQRNYYEHIIRDEKDHLAIYDYIISNPLNWERDEEYC